MNRYEGNTGRFIRMPEPEPDLRPRRSPPPPPRPAQPPGPQAAASAPGASYAAPGTAAASAATAAGQAAARRRAGRDTGRHPRTAGHSQLGDGGPAADAGALSHVPRERRQRAAHHPCRHALPLGGQRLRLDAVGCGPGLRWGLRELGGGKAAQLALRGFRPTLRRLRRSLSEVFARLLQKAVGSRGKAPRAARWPRNSPSHKMRRKGAWGNPRRGFPPGCDKDAEGCAPVYGGVCGSLGVGKPLSRRFAAFVLRCVRGAPH